MALKILRRLEGLNRRIM